MPRHNHETPEEPADRRATDNDDSGARQRLTPRTPVKLCLRDFVVLIVAIVGICVTVVTGLRTLQTADALAATRIDQIERRVATKADLRELAKGIRLCIVQPLACGELDSIGKSADYPTKKETP